MGEIRIGISGWRYPPWRGTFYPPGLPQKKELEFAAEHFNSIEINGSFYSLQDVPNWQRWYEQTPPGFAFSVKGSRYITHMLKLRNIGKPLANFFAQGILALREKLGPILWQFPAAVPFDPKRFEEFFEALPRTTPEALHIARHRDYRMKGRSFLRAPVDLPLRHAVEIRHPSFDSPEFFAMLRRHKIALVVADTAGKWPFLEEVTADFVYARLHGDKQLYVSGYSPSALKTWASRVDRWSRAGDVYVYFDNDVKVRAPFDAIGLSRRVDQAA